MAEGNRALWVAVVGIAATALVGIFGTGAAWLSARNDRRAQQELAHEERSYERRVSVYLGALSFLDGQERALYDYGNSLASERGIFELDLPTHFDPDRHVFRRFIPFQPEPPRALRARLRVFGSPQALHAFQLSQALFRDVPLTSRNLGRPELMPRHPNSPTYNHFVKTYKKFFRQINRFQEVIHDDVG